MRALLTTILIVSLFIYLIWAIIHHKKNQSLTLQTFLEYLLTASLALILVMGVLYQ